MLYSEYIDLMAQGEKILAVVIGESTEISDCELPQQQPLGEVLTWEAAAQHLAYDFDDGTSADGVFIGVPQIVTVWTTHHVIFTVAGTEYYPDLERVPRNPIKGKPAMIE